MVCGIHSRCGRGGREAAGGLILKAWVGLGLLGNRGSREGLCPGYLVFWSAWSVVEQALSVRAGDRDTVDSQEGRPAAAGVAALGVESASLRDWVCWGNREQIKTF